MVHCFMGASRSVSAVVYYLMTEHKMTIEEAIKYIRDKRAAINPNNKFVEALKNHNKTEELKEIDMSGNYIADINKKE